MDECIHCEGAIEQIDGIWYHSRIEDFSHLARPNTAQEG